MASSDEDSDAGPGMDHPHPPVRERVSKKNTVRRKGSEWEILGNLESGVKYTIKPRKYEGYLSKKRKWPLKGWHKR